MKYFLPLIMLFGWSLPTMSAPLLCAIEAGAPCLVDNGDTLFSVTDTDGVDDDITTFIINRNAGFNNAFGIYDPFNPGNRMQVYSGADAPGFGSGQVLQWDGLSYSIQGTASSILLGQPQFGLYIDWQSDTWFSQPSLNSDGFDHLAVFSTEGQGGTTNGFDLVFAWEDLPNGGDMDFNDIVVGCIDCTSTRIPEPGALALFGAGLSAFGLMGFRRRAWPDGNA